MQSPETHTNRRNRTQSQSVIRKKETQGRLIWFFVCMLAAILFSQTLITSLINRVILPAVQASFLPGTSLDPALSGTQLLSFLSGLSLILLLQAFLRIIPVIAPVILPLQERLNTLISRQAPQLAPTALVQKLHGWDGFLLVLIFFGLILLEILPFVIFGWLYIRFVLRRTEQIIREDELWHEEQDKNKNLMLADIAHDIRNPMTTIAGYAQALEEGMIHDPEKQKEYLSAIRRKSERVTSLISTLFEYTKLNSTGFSLKKSSVDLCELLRENTAELYTDAEEKGIELVTEIPEEPFSVSADPLQVSRVFSNLIGNAVRYNPSGTKILISLSTNKTGDGDTHIVVADTGLPISDETASRIFEPFSRGDVSRSTDGGSGLGLSISESIVRMHGWELTLETAFPGYTKAFVIRIPW